LVERFLVPPCWHQPSRRRLMMFCWRLCAPSRQSRIAASLVFKRPRRRFYICAIEESTIRDQLAQHSRRGRIELGGRCGFKATAADRSTSLAVRMPVQGFVSADETWLQQLARMSKPRNARAALVAADVAMG